MSIHWHSLGIFCKKMIQKEPIQGEKLTPHILSPNARLCQANNIYILVREYSWDIMTAVKSFYDDLLPIFGRTLQG